jgi:hypothetical protein
MKHTATIFMRGGGSIHTELDMEGDWNTAANSLGRRMADTGYIICSEKRWGYDKTWIINAPDVSAIEIVQNEQQ